MARVTEFMWTMGIGLLLMLWLCVITALILGACLLIATEHYVLGGLALSPFFFAMAWLLGAGFRA